MRFIHLVLLYHIFTLCRGDSIADDFYVTLRVVEGEAGYRIFNGTHQFGFHSTVEDSRGVVVIEENGDLSGLRECWRSRFLGYSGKYHLFMPVDGIDRSTTEEILRSNCLAGIILYAVPSFNRSKPLSHDAACPNSESGFSKEQCMFNVWNQEGAILPQGLRNIDWNIQILYIHNQTYIDAIRKCHKLFNMPNSTVQSSVSLPLCSASFGVFSRGAGSTEICIRRSEMWPEIIGIFTGSSSHQCGPLFGINVIVHLPPKNHTEAADSHSTRYLMLTARLDSFGLIPEISPGEISVVTSVIALLAVIQVIGKNMNVFEQASLASNRHLLIAFFDGESFDYIGSGSAAYDMMHSAFPRISKKNLKERLELIFASQLDGIIEVQQLGSTTDGRRLYAHGDGNQIKNGLAVGLLTSLWDGVTVADGILVPPTEYSEMPPSSWNSFAKINSSIPGLVLAPYQIKYQYLRYNSMLDRAQWNSTERSAVISQVVVAASALLRTAADYIQLDTDTKSKLKIEREFVSKLFECLIDSDDWFSCDYLNNITGIRSPDPLSYNGKSTYVKVGARERLRFPVQVLTMYLTGTTAHAHSDEIREMACRQFGVGQNDGVCRMDGFREMQRNFHGVLHFHCEGDVEVYTYTVLNDPETNTSHCYRTPVHLYYARSPAFTIKDYNFTNSTYSTWSEATYSTADLQLFLIEDKSVEVKLFVFGIFFCILSFMVVIRCEEEFIMTGESEDEESPDSKPEEDEEEE